MLRTDEYVSTLECPECQKKKLKIWFSSGGDGNSQLLLKCNSCNTYITTNLIPNTNDWIINKENKKRKGGRLWNQA